MYTYPVYKSYGGEVVHPNSHTPCHLQQALNTQLLIIGLQRTQYETVHNIISNVLTRIRLSQHILAFSHKPTTFFPKQFFFHTSEAGCTRISNPTAQVSFSLPPSSFKAMLLSPPQKHEVPHWSPPPPPLLLISENVIHMKHSQATWLIRLA